MDHFICLNFKQKLRKTKKPLNSDNTELLSFFKISAASIEVLDVEKNSKIQMWYEKKKKARMRVSFIKKFIPNKIRKFCENRTHKMGQQEISKNL